MNNEEDKFRKDAGREAAKRENDGKFLNDEALEDDLIDVSAEDSEEEGEGIINPEHPENQEWHVRELQNRH